MLMLLDYIFENQYIYTAYERWTTNDKTMPVFDKVKEEEL